MNRLPSLFLGGPTASGKSDLALALAERLHGEIISVDSMQVYSGLDIGTAKPSAADRARVPHHLLDVVSVRDPFDAAQFVALAQAAVAEINRRGKIAIFCGGTGLYFKAYHEGLGEGPATSNSLRAELEQRPLENLLAELRERDPQACEQIDCHNPRRVIRALEIVRLSGKPLAVHRAAWTPAAAVPHFYGLFRAPDDLARRIEQRVDRMLAEGLIDETRSLLDRGLTENRNAMQAIGYRQAVEFLQGVRSLADTAELIKQKTRRYAKKQLTWFRGQFSLHWLSATSAQDEGQWVDQIATAYLEDPPARS